MPASTKPAENCPCCGSEREIKPLGYPVIRAPRHSCLLFDSRSEALAFPRGEIDLQLCHDCGFIFNRCFDPASQHFSGRYEETQGYSPRFNAFTDQLVRQLVEDFHLHHMDAVEIGCGKGEFLSRFCVLGDNRGVGIDPSYVPGRNPDEPAGKVRFIRELLGPQHARLKADLYVCRHTLEHIPAPAAFLDLLGKVSAGNTGARIFFDLPDMSRILKEGAFWDIYYEHCNYFTPLSLARLFRSRGFAVTDLWRDYDDQYIMLMAQPAGESAGGRHAIEATITELVQDVHAFSENCAKQINAWKQAIQEILARSGNRIVLWGSGSKGVAFLTTLQIHDEIARVVDINPHKHGKFMPGTGQEIVAPESLADDPPTHVIIMNAIYEGEIRQSLNRLGLAPVLLPVGNKLPDTA